jgi:hypothetical protein
MAQTTETVTMKTLPMKYKAMQYALASFISKQSSFDEAVKTTLYKELMLFAPVAEQVSFFEAEYDLKTIEKNIVKPIIKAQKDAEKKANAPVKEKKPRAPRKKEEAGKKESEPKQAKPKTKSKKASTKETEPAPVAEDAPEVEFCCGKECYTSADDDHEILRCQHSGMPKEDCTNQTDTETKSETMEKEEKKEEALTDEMEAEPYVETPKSPAAPAPVPTAAKPKKEKKEKKVKEEDKNEKNEKNDKNEKKKVTKKSKPVDDENKTPKMPNARLVIKNPEEKYLLFQNDKRYWCTDVHFKNGAVYEDTTDADGDSAPGREIGTIENGVLMIHHDV